MSASPDVGSAAVPLLPPPSLNHGHGRRPPPPPRPPRPPSSVLLLFTSYGLLLGAVFTLTHIALSAHPTAPRRGCSIGGVPGVVAGARGGGGASKAAATAATAASAAASLPGGGGGGHPASRWGAPPVDDVSGGPWLFCVPTGGLAGEVVYSVDWAAPAGEEAAAANMAGARAATAAAPIAAAAGGGGRWEWERALATRYGTRHWTFGGSAAAAAVDAVADAAVDAAAVDVWGGTPPGSGGGLAVRGGPAVSPPVLTHLAVELGADPASDPLALANVPSAPTNAPLATSGVPLASEEGLLDVSGASSATSGAPLASAGAHMVPARRQTNASAPSGAARTATTSGQGASSASTVAAEAAAAASASAAAPAASRWSLPRGHTGGLSLIAVPAATTAAPAEGTFTATATADASAGSAESPSALPLGSTLPLRELMGHLGHGRLAMLKMELGAVGAGVVHSWRVAADAEAAAAAAAVAATAAPLAADEQPGGVANAGAVVSGGMLVPPLLPRSVATPAAPSRFVPTAGRAAVTTTAAFAAAGRSARPPRLGRDWYPLSSSIPPGALPVDQLLVAFPTASDPATAVVFEDLMALGYAVLWADGRRATFVRRAAAEAGAAAAAGAGGTEAAAGPGPPPAPALGDAAAEDVATGGVQDDGWGWARGPPRRRNGWGIR
ncbi:hypothetical protein MMPV_000258 [Pyropia vietnamensis]